MIHDIIYYHRGFKVATLMEKLLTKKDTRYLAKHVFVKKFFSGFFITIS